jgi:hypothetical protein
VIDELRITIKELNSQILMASEREKEIQNNFFL